MPDDQVRLSDLTTEATGSKSAVRELQPLQRVGYSLARYVLAAMAVAIVVILWLSFVYLPQPLAPAPPSVQASDSVAQYKGLVDAYIPLANQALERAEKLLQTVVVTVFLPSFTAILGYIFGTRTAGSSENE
jgi:hypothetical protein